MAEIKKIKEDVNQCRKERVIFDNVFKKLEMDLKLKEDEFRTKLKDSIEKEKKKKLRKKI